MTSQASSSEAPVTDPLDSTQMTWDVYVSLRRQSPNTPAEIRVFERDDGSDLSWGQAMRAESSGSTDASDPSHSLSSGAFSSSRYVSSPFCYVLQTRRQRLLLRQGQMGVIPSPRLTLWLDGRADRAALADVAAAEGFPE